MDKLDRIIKESISRVITESEKNANRVASKLGYKAAKNTKGKRSQLGRELDAERKKGTLNVRGLASVIYGIPKGTKNHKQMVKLNGKTSELRKKIAYEPGEGGGHFDLDDEEKSAIEQALE